MGRRPGEALTQPNPTPPPFHWDGGGSRLNLRNPPPPTEIDDGMGPGVTRSDGSGSPPAPLPPPGAALQAFDATPDFLKALDLDDEALKRAIIGAIGDYDQYSLPDARGYTAFARWLLGVSEGDRQRTRDEILSTGRGHFRAFGETLEALRGEGGRVVVVGSAGGVQGAREEGGLDLREITPM